MPFTGNPDPFLSPDSGAKVRISQSQCAVFCSAQPHSGAHRTREIPFPTLRPRKLLIAVCPIRIFRSSTQCRCSRGSSIDFLSLEALLRVAIAVHSNQLAHPASAHGIALAMENEIDGFAGL